MCAVARIDAFVPETDHLAEDSLGDEVDCGHAKPCSENTIVRRGRTAALDVSEHTHAHLAFREQHDRMSYHVADRDGTSHVLHLRRKMDAFSHEDDREVLSICFPRCDV